MTAHAVTKRLDRDAVRGSSWEASCTCGWRARALNLRGITRKITAHLEQLLGATATGWTW